jgi:hypothetical protein
MKWVIALGRTLRVVALSGLALAASFAPAREASFPSLDCPGCDPVQGAEGITTSSGSVKTGKGLDALAAGGAGILSGPLGPVSILIGAGVGWGVNALLPSVPDVEWTSVTIVNPTKGVCNPETCAPVGPCSIQLSATFRPNNYLRPPFTDNNPAVSGSDGAETTAPRGSSTMVMVPAEAVCGGGAVVVSLKVGTGTASALLSCSPCD